MKEWLTAMGISVADGVDEETFARFLQHLSTNPQLQYRERLDWLLSTRNINLQLQSLQRYEEQFSSSAAPASVQTTVESLIVEFSVSCEATFSPMGQANAAVTPSDEETQLAFAIAQLFQAPGIEVHEDHIAFHAGTESASFAGFLDGCATANDDIGFVKTALVLRDLASRLIPETPQFELQRALNLNRRGVALRKLEHFERAMEHQAAAFAILTHAAQSNDAVSALDIALFALDCADIAAVCGETAEAQEALRMVDELITNFPEGEVVTTLRARMAVCRGVLHMVAGKTQEARPLFEEALSLFRQLPQEQLPPLAFFIMNALRHLVAILEMTNDWNALTSTLVEMQYFFEDNRSLGRPDLELERTRFGIAAAGIEMRKGNVIAPDNDLQAALAVFERHQYRDRPHLHMEAAILLGNLGASLLKEKPQEALPHFEAAERLLLPQHQAMHPMAAPLLGCLYGNWAAAQRSLNNLPDALVLIDRSLQFFVPSQQDVVGDHDVMAARVYCVRANIYFDMGDSALAAQEYRKTIALFEQPGYLLRHELTRDRMTLYRSAARLLGKEFDSEWAATCSQHMAIGLEAFDPDGYEGLFLWRQFVQFHCEWLQYCAGKGLQAVPAILSALQGRNLARHCHEAPETNSDDAELQLLRRAMKSSRDEFRISDMHARQAFDEWLRDSTSGRKPNRSSDDFFASSLAAHDRYVEDAERFKKRRREIHAAGNSDGLFRPFQSIATDTLLKSLSAGEVLVCCIDLPHWIPGDTAPKDLTALWILEASGAMRWVELDIDLDRCTDLDGAVQRSGRSQGRMRRGPSSRRRGHGKMNFEELSAELGSAFGSPLQAALPAQPTRVIFVTHGRFHLLPFDLANPFQCPVLHFPGLRFLADSFPAAPTDTPATFLVLQNLVEELVFANREGIPLLGEIWKNAGKVEAIAALPQTDTPTFVERLHLSGHGGIRSPRRKRQWGTLYYGPNETIEEYELAQSSIRARGVWLSTCVVGYTEEDEEGDPVGFTIPFLLQGSRCVIASLTAVPDRWMPLLVGLTEWLAVRRSLELSTALRLAKAMLPDWIEREELQEFQIIYRAWLHTTWLALVEHLWKSSGLAGEQQDPAALWAQFVAELVHGVLEDDATISAATLAAMQCTAASGPLMDYLVSISLVPPERIRRTLCYAVRAFGI